MRISACRVLPKNLVKPNQRLQHGLPGSVGYVAQAAYTYTNRESIAGGILHQATTTGSDSFQQNELQCRDQCPQFAEIQNRCLLKGLAKRSESLLVEAIISHVEKCLCEGQHSRDNLSLASTSMGKPSQRLEFGGDIQHLGIQQREVVTKPAKIGRHRRMRKSSLRRGKQGFERACQPAAALPEGARGRRTRQPAQLGGELRSRVTQHLRIQNLPGRLMVALFLCNHDVDVSVVRHSISGSLTITGGLHLKHFGVAAAEMSELIMISVFRDMPIFEHYDAICHANGGKPMGNKQGHFPVCQFGKALKDFKF